MQIINGQTLQYNHDGDAGYDLLLNLETSSINSNKLLTSLEKSHTANLNWHKASGGYLPKLYINSKLIGDYLNKQDLDKFISSVRESKTNGAYSYLQPYVILPPARVSYPNLAFELANYPNTELVSTSFDFTEPDQTILDKLNWNITTRSSIDFKLNEIYNIAGFVYPRSGLGAKHQITISNNVGVVDIGYRNNVMVALENRGRDIHMFTNGCRIAQLVLGVILNNGYKLEPLEDDSRGLNGFGSTGVNT